MLVQLNLDPSDKELRQFGYIALAAFAALGGVVFLRGGLLGADFGDASRGVAAAFWVSGLASAVFSLVYPKANRPLFVGLSAVTYPVGIVISHLVLALLFFGILTPVALLFRLVGRDPLERKLERERKSYWVELPASSDAEEYFRQF